MDMGIYVGEVGQERLLVNLPRIDPLQTVNREPRPATGLKQLNFTADMAAFRVNSHLTGPLYQPASAIFERSDLKEQPILTDSSTSSNLNRRAEYLVCLPPATPNQITIKCSVPCPALPAAKPPISWFLNGQACY